MKHVYILRLMLISSLLITLLQVSSVHAAELIRHSVDVDGHPMALWEKSVPAPKGHILLHHGRTWSSLPDFDLHVPGEGLSLMDGFNAMGFSVWALDARGYGGTSRDSSGWHTPDRAARDMAIVLDWLQARNGEKTHVWGWSYGSMVAQLTAQRYPQAFRSVTLFGYPADPDAEVPNDTNAGEPPRQPTTAEAAASDFIVPGAISQHAIDTFVAAALAADPVRADWNQLHQWNELDGALLTVPVLLLQAEFDPLANTDAHARLFVSIPNANKQWVVLAGGAHAALLESPRARLIRASVDFMQWIDQ
jgi:pimeloyl-ACP methyl ester carboxylesterase